MAGHAQLKFVMTECSKAHMRTAKAQTSLRIRSLASLRYLLTQCMDLDEDSDRATSLTLLSDCACPFTGSRTSDTEVRFLTSMLILQLPLPQSLPNMAASVVGAGVAGMKDQYEDRAIGGDQIVVVVVHGLTPCVDTPGLTPTDTAACSGGGAGTNRLLKSKMR